MPFTYKVPVPNELSPCPTVLLKEWLLNPGDYVNVGYGLALLQTGQGLFELCANGEGFVHCHSVNKEEEILNREEVCLLAADGEKIPYGRPYSTCRLIE